MFKVFWVGARGSLSLVKKENYLPLVLRKSDIFRLECNEDKEEIVMHYHEHPANPVNRMRNYAKQVDRIEGSEKGETLDNLILFLNDMKTHNAVT